MLVISPHQLKIIIMISTIKKKKLHQNQTFLAATSTKNLGSTAQIWSMPSLKMNKLNAITLWDGHFGHSQLLTITHLNEATLTSVTTWLRCLRSWERKTEWDRERAQPCGLSVSHLSWTLFDIIMQTFITLWVFETEAGFVSFCNFGAV